MDDLESALSKLEDIKSEKDSLEEDLDSLTDVLEDVRAEASKLAVEELFEFLHDYDGEVSVSRIDRDGSFLQLFISDPPDGMTEPFTELGRVVQVGSIDPSNHGRTIVRTTPPDSNQNGVLDIQFSFRNDPHDDLVGLLESFVDEYDLELVKGQFDYDKEIDDLRNRLEQLERLTTLFSG